MLERKHAEALGALRFHSTLGESADVRRMRIEESDARIDLGVAIAELEAHMRRQHGVENCC